MTIETPEPTTAERRKAGLAKARAAKAERAAKAKQEIKFESEDPEALNKKRAALLAELSALPDPAPVVPGAAPGTLVKDGLGADKVPWTPAVLRDYCNRGITVNGVTFGWKSILGDGKILSVSWQGIVYWLWPDVENKVPSVHHAVYMQALEDKRRENAKWAAPPAPGPGNLDGYSSAMAHNDLGHVMGVGPLEPRGE